jgi:hypothetical protein
MADTDVGDRREDRELLATVRADAKVWRSHHLDPLAAEAAAESRNECTVPRPCTLTTCLAGHYSLFEHQTLPQSGHFALAAFSAGLIVFSACGETK